MATTSRSARYAKWLSIPLGLILSALLIWQASYAAFSDTVTSPDNSWTAGSVTLGPDDTVRTLFDEKKLLRGATGTDVITVTYTGSLDAKVSFYGADYTSTNGLGENIQLVITGTEGPASGVIFDGTLATFSETTLEFDTPGGVKRSGTFEFTYTVKDDAPQSIQGGTVNIDFVLESRSN